MLGKLTKAVQGVKPLEVAQNQLPEALKNKLPPSNGKRDSKASKESVNDKTVETVKENPREVVNEKPPTEKKPTVINEKPPKPARESFPEEKISILSRAAAVPPVISTDNACTHSKYKPVATRPDQRGRLERCCMCCASCYRENGSCTFRNACFAACIFLMLIGSAKLITFLLVGKSHLLEFLEPMLFFVGSPDSPKKAHRFSSIVTPTTALLYDLIPAILILIGALRYSETSCIVFTSMMIIGTTVAFLQAFFITLYLIIEQYACIRNGIEGCGRRRHTTRQLSAAAIFSYILTGIRFHFLKCSLGFSHEIRNGLYEKTRGEPTTSETPRSFVPTASENTDAVSPPPFANNAIQEIAKLSATDAPDKTSIPTSEASGPRGSEEKKMSNDSSNQAKPRRGSVGSGATGTVDPTVPRQPSNMAIKAKKSKSSTAKATKKVSQFVATRDSKVHPK